MARRGKKSAPSVKTAAWKASREDEVALVGEAAKGDPAARNAVLKAIYNDLRRIIAASPQAGGILRDPDGPGEIFDMILEWLEETHKDGRTGWKKLGDFQGDAALATYLYQRVVHFFILEYVRRCAARPDQLSAVSEDEEAEGGAFGDGGGVGEGLVGRAGGEGEESLVALWSDEEVERVRAAHSDPTHRLAYYLTDLLHRFPPPEEVAHAAEALGQGREALARRICDLRTVLIDRELERDARESKKTETLERKGIRLQTLCSKQQRGEKLRQTEKTALRNLPGDIRKIGATLQALRRKWEEDPVAPTNQEVRDVLFPDPNKGKDRTTVSSWIQTIRKKLRGMDGGAAGGSVSHDDRRGQPPSSQQRGGLDRLSSRRQP